MPVCYYTYNSVAFCVVAVSKFCEAIVEYMANITSAPDPNIQIEFFYGEVYSAWEIFFSVWLGSKEAKVLSLLCTLTSNAFITLSV